MVCGRVNIRQALVVLLAVAVASTALLLVLQPPSRTRDIEKIRAALAMYDQGPGRPVWHQMERLDRVIRWVSDDRVEVSVMADIAGRPFYRNYTLTRQGDDWVVTRFSTFHWDLGLTRPLP